MEPNIKTAFTKEKNCPKCGNSFIDVSLFKPNSPGGFVRVRCMSCLHTIGGWGQDLEDMVLQFSAQWENGEGGLDETRFSTTNPRKIQPH